MTTTVQQTETDAIIIETGFGRLRPWRDSDVDALVVHGDNREIWRNVGARFPHPYTREAAVGWIGLAKTLEPAKGEHFVIEVAGELVGAIGYDRLEDVFCGTAQVGYWVGEAHWGRGIATDALSALTARLFEDPAIIRVQALVYGWNPGSGRVLEKAGFVLEGRLRNAVSKGGEVTDELIYGRVRS